MILPVALLVAGLLTGDPQLSPSELADLWGGTGLPVLIAIALMLAAAACSVLAIRRRGVPGVRARLSALAAACLVVAVAVVALGDAVTG